ncbi:MAG: hypothetical protein ACRC33_16450, partial [Gemmataceae bacterium]
PVAPLQTVLGSTLTGAKAQVVSALTVTRSQMFHFVLTAAGQAQAGVRLTILDSLGTVVQTVAARTGDSASLTVWLMTPGEYYFVFAGGSSDGAVLSSLAYTLKSVELSDPIEPYLIDPIGDAAKTTGPALTDTDYYWQMYSAATSFLDTTDPHSQYWY